MINFNEKFKQDLKEGQSNERYIASILLKKGYKVDFNTSTDLAELRKWDLKVEGKEVNYFECKRDYKCQTTGNVAIEVRCAEHSTSEYWTYTFDENEVYYTTLTNIKKMLSEAVPGWFIWGGDNNKAYMKIIKKEVFLKFVKKLNIND